ncbi:MAG: tetratricopeptide repeat protein [Bryobacteraceae bacterium]|jgi:Tfp pilus assembly protein PilF
MWALLPALFFLQAADPNADGLKALDAARYFDAAASFEKAIAADPADFSAHFNLALAYGFLNRDSEAIEQYRKTLALKPNLYEAELNCGMLLLRQKNPADAAPLLEDAARQKPAEFRPHYYLAEAQFALAAWENAEARYREALAVNPKSGGAELGLGRALARQGKLAEAEPHYRRAAEIDARDRGWLLELAELYQNSHQPSQALAIYQEFPQDPQAQSHAGQLMLDSRQYADAVPRLEAAFAADASQVNRIALAMAYLFAGQLPKALPLMAEAVRADPSNFQSRMMYARALRDARQFPAAADQFSEAVKLKPADAPAWRDLADMLYMAGNLPLALENFDKARQLGEDTAGVCFMRAIILDKLRQLKPALDAYTRFLSMSQGKHPDQEFQARQRARIIRRELEKR